MAYKASDVHLSSLISVCFVSFGILWLDHDDAEKKSLFFATVNAFSNNFFE